MRRMLFLLPLMASLGACIDIPQGAPGRQRVSQSTAAFTPRPEARQCLADLGAKQANFTPLPDQYYGAGCATLNTVRITGLQGDRALLGLTNLGPVTCPLADALANWARFGVDRAARQIMGSGLARIETMGSYNCRNVAGSSRRSGHATANAVDIAAFVLVDGRRISVLGDWIEGSAKEREFLRTVHQSACKRFGVVLGPAYNAAHRDHLHLEPGNRAYCR